MVIQTTTIKYKEKTFKFFKKKNSKIKIAFAVGIASLSFIIPDGAFMLGLSTLILHPLGFKKGLTTTAKQTKQNIKHYILMASFLGVNQTIKKIGVLKKWN